MASIRGVSVPMYTTLRRTTVLFTMITEFFLVGQRHTAPIISRSVTFCMVLRHLTYLQILNYATEKHQL